MRRLKIYAFGDFWKKLIKPRIILQGNWLANAGFLPNEHVQVQVEYGRLTITKE